MLRTLEIKFKSMTMNNGDEYRNGRLMATTDLKPLFTHFLKVRSMDANQPDMYVNPREIATLIPDINDLRTNQATETEKENADWSNFFKNPNDTSSAEADVTPNDLNY